jgi:CspA family cold shock protein
MPNHGRGRPSRRRGFDDDFAFDRPSFDRPGPERPAAGAAVAFGPEVEAKVKWFSAEKGFGFVELADGSGDAFLHINTLGAIGQTMVPPGATLTIRVGQGQKGKQVSQVVSVDASTATAEARPMGGARGPAPRRAAAGPAVEKAGTVKWYNPGKGFGFVAVSDGGKDVFVHATVLQRAGLEELAEGAQVVVGVVQGAKGPEATSIRLG